MPDIGKALKDEIARISKREAKSLMNVHIKTIRNLKREITELKKQVAKPQAKPPSEIKEPVNANPEGKNVWFTSKGIKSMRKRFDLTRAQMGKLCGVSPNAVGLWEKNTGKLNLRNKTRDALINLRKMTPTAVKKTLAE